ncbi:MAG TPA: purine-binding chemotaxis protein CheW [Firmicutes bacterium]|nr:purine-binding chemotaxis protein CheW [Bacillota bacterium]
MSAAGATGVRTGEQALVVFQLSKEEYAITVDRVREVVNAERITRVPGAPEYVLGVVNLRGRVVPVLDLRRRLGLPPDNPEHPRIMVVEDGPAVVGMLVDRASEVLRLGAGQLKDPDEVLEGDEDHRFVEAVANVNGRLIVVLRPLELLARDDRQTIVEMGSTQALGRA